MPIIIAIVLVLGIGGGTIAVADNAVPGDALFGIDRATESVRLALSSDDRKSELKARFAEERIEEVESLIKDADEVEIDIETESEDDMDDSDTEVEIEREADIEAGLSFAIDLLGEIDSEGQYSDLVTRLNNLVDTLPEDTKLDIKVSDSGSSFLRLRSEDGTNRFDVEVKDNGETTIIKTRDGESRVEVDVRNDRIEIDIEDDDSDIEDAMDEISDAENEILQAVEDIEDAKTDEKETALSEQTLDSARKELAAAQAALQAGNYSKAEELAEVSKDLAQLARMKYLGKTEADISEDDDSDDADEMDDDSDDSDDSDDETDEEDEIDDDSDDVGDSDDSLDDSDNSGSGSN